VIEMPPRIARLPRDRRGYPIPWNVQRDANGLPLFTVNDDRKHVLALRHGRCPICGERLGRWKWFIGGPLSAFDPAGCYIDLPMHHECARFALQTCPHLAAPRYMRHDHIPHDAVLQPELRLMIDETVMPERPELFVALASARVIVGRWEPLELPRIRPAEPYLGCEFWRHGEQIPVDEAMPILRGIFGADFVLPPMEDS
jgi:hypothetical protein